MASLFESILSAVPIVGSLFGGGGGGGGGGASAGMTRQELRTYTQADPLRMSALVQQALRAGLDPSLIFSSLTQPGVGLSKEQALQMMGLPPNTQVTIGSPAVPAVAARNWGYGATRRTTPGTPAVPAVAASLTLPAGYTQGGVYSNPEQQSIINQGYRQNADTIDAASRQKMAELIAQGYTPALANAIARSWATDQITRSKLSGEADLMQRSVGSQQELLSNLSGLSTIPVGSAGVAANAANTAKSEQSDLWSAVAGLAQVLGQNTGTTKPGTTTSPIPAIGNTGSWGGSSSPFTTANQGFSFGNTPFGGF